jgi:sec-independent protein translocase protein TatA
MHFGSGELIMLALIVLIIFSASRMSALGNAVGKFVYSFKKSSTGKDLIDVTPRKFDRAAPTEKTIDAEVRKK